MGLFDIFKSKSPMVELSVQSISDMHDRTWKSAYDTGVDDCIGYMHLAGANLTEEQQSKLKEFYKTLKDM